ncbi:ATP-binding cassette domain-containing protein [Sodalis ligni]|jgi:ribose transport system ATP-binding protein|uniref:Monosaccharide ABC transporter ATP-binding protein (CUT2 family) n=1 Tax=Sodalis ligni TaxID=2697027 RepID=A0A4R1NES7_9GAMM|nr:sugar ABC transporter ATP-binding protein [Sodalis ligni]TCL03156.1 monosaccharide ABC transporter ATP-binding protein (CUT2 family) [Sodalis ligni]
MMNDNFSAEAVSGSVDNYLVELSQVSRHFGAVQAMVGVDLKIRPGRMMSILGHNGAGKSTLIKILAGTLPQSSGSITISGEDVTHRYNMRRAYAHGIRCVFQELSLCPNLRVFENTRVLHPTLSGRGWRNTARRLIGDALDRIFPEHGIDVNSPVCELPLSQRQMVEIARAFTVVDAPIRVIILDEPTSSLDPSCARQLLDFTRKIRHYGIACIFISHKLREIIDYSDDIVVMRDGRITAREVSNGLSESDLLDKMGMVAASAPAAGPAAAGGDGGRMCVEHLCESYVPFPFYVNVGEVVGLAGLSGHGQRELLLRILAAAKHADRTLRVTGEAVYIAGDRQNEGIFPLWSVGENLTIGVLKQLTRRGLVDLAEEEKIALEWRDKLKIKVPFVGDPITGLSGGNQQKVLVARALACRPNVVLLDDPLRGVDVQTKNELYAEVRTRIQSGCSFVWFTTENAELAICDRIYVFNQGLITDAFTQGEYTEDRLIRASFKGGLVDVSK